MDTCMRLAEKSWDSEDERVIQSASADDFEQTILSLRGEELATFMYTNLKIYELREQDTQFGTAPLHFLAACRRIAVRRDGTHLADLMRDAFDESGVGQDLEQRAAESTQDSTLP